MKKLIQAVNKSICTRIAIPGSKSVTNRALLLAALASGVSEISDILLSDDTWAFIHALQALGISIQVDEKANSCIIGGCAGEFPQKKASIWCADAGTVARFLLAACGVTKGEYQFDGSARLRERPVAPLLQVLSSQGVRILTETANKMPLTLMGIDKLEGGEIKINGAESSQFVSALLMIAPFAKRALVLDVHDVVSNPYVDMTCSMMSDFGVLVRRLHHARFSVPVPQQYMARDYVVEPDLSTASYFFAAAAVTGGEVTIQSLQRHLSMQGDVAFLTVLEKMGCQVIEATTGLTVRAPERLRGVNVDMRDFSDTFMTLSAIAPFATTPTTMTNIGHTRLQESNRITAMRESLEKLNIKVEEGPDWLRVHPSEPQGGVVNSFHDHRIAMSLSIIGLRVPGVEIDHAECVAKTCPLFFDLWDRL